MKRKPVEKKRSAQDTLAQKILGPTCVAFDYKLDTKRSGWLRLFSQKDMGAGSLEFVGKHWQELALIDVRLFVGNGGFLPKPLSRLYTHDVVYALPNLPVLSIVELAQTGTHNQTDDNWKRVSRAMKLIMDICPFEVQFADQAGLKATFLSKPTAAQAKTFGNLILDVNTDAISITEGELWWNSTENHWEVGNENGEMLELKFDELIPYYIMKHNKFSLWWD